MGRTAVTFIPRSTNSADAAKFIDLADIPADVQEEIEGVYQQLKTHVGSFYVKFDSVAEKNQYVKFAQAYAFHRPKGQIKFHVSPIKGRAADSLELNFTVRDLSKENEKATEEIREATENAKAKK